MPFTVSTQGAYAYLSQRLGSRTETDEVFQEVFLKVHRARNQYDFKYSVLQWLYVISRTTLLDYYRNKSRTVPTVTWDDSFPLLSQTAVGPALSPSEGPDPIDITRRAATREPCSRCE